MPDVQYNNPEEHSVEETIVGIKYPDDSISFGAAGGWFPALGTFNGDNLLTEKGRGEAQDTYAKFLKQNGIPITKDSRLRFITRTVITTLTAVTDLEED